MLSQNLTLADHGATNHTFNLNFQQGTEVRRVDVASSPSEPLGMIIRHSVSKRNSLTSDRHNIVFSNTIADHDTGGLFTDTVSLTITSDRSDVTGTNDVLNLVAFLKNFLSDANVTAVMRGES
jgi:hypothetical protein